MGLFDFLFGRQVKFQDSIIGELTTKVKKDNPSINYTWTGSTKLTGQLKETFFILEGNNHGPYKDQLNSVHRIVDTLNDIIASVDREIKGMQNVKPRYMRDWTKEYHLAMVSPYDPNVKGVGKKFEVNFEPLDEKDLDYIGLIWDNGKLIEIKPY
jgi:hypothetical protein